jgi:hypothetical protein
VNLISEALAAGTAVAAVDGPFSSTNIVPTLWMVAISMLGGAASFYRKVQNGEVRYFNLMELIGELIVSGFVGIITFWICKSYAVDAYLTAVACGVTGHMGTRAIAVFEKVLASKLGVKGDIDADNRKT